MKRINLNKEFDVPERISKKEIKKNIKIKKFRKEEYKKKNK